MQNPVKPVPKPSSTRGKTSLSSPFISKKVVKYNPKSSSGLPLIEQFYNLPISRKTQMITALIFLALGGLIGLSSSSLVGSLRSHLLYQTKSQLAVSELNYNTDLDKMGLGATAKSEHPTIIEATKIFNQGESLSPEIRTQLESILKNEQKLYGLEYVTLVDKTSRIIANANSPRQGEIFNPQGLVTRVMAQKKQIRTSELVSLQELIQEKVPLPAGLRGQDALIRYTITPVKLPGTQTVIGTLISGDIVNGNSDIVKKNVQTFQDIGYSAVYLYNPENKQFSLATAFEKTELRNSNLNTALPANTSILKKAVQAQGKTVGERGYVNNHNYTLAAKALPNHNGNEVAILVYGDRELGLNRILKDSLVLQLGLSVAVLGVVVVVAGIIASAITKPIKRLQKVTQRFASGDYHARVEGLSQDEVGELGTYFNEMANNIATHQEGLQEKTKMFRFLAELSSTQTLDPLALESWFYRGLEGAKSLVKLDRLFIYYFAEDDQDQVKYEVVSPGFTSVLEQEDDSEMIPTSLLQELQATLSTEEWTLEQLDAISENSGYRESLERLQVKEQLIIPIYNQKTLYGCLFAQRCTHNEQWQETEINFLKQFVSQIQVTINRITLAQTKALESGLARVLKEITLKISTEIITENLFDLVVQSSRDALKTDRVIVYSFDENWKGTVIAESVNPAYPATLGQNIPDPCFAKSFVDKYRQGRVKALTNIHKAGLDSCDLQQLQSLEIQANLVVPIVAGGELLGLLIAHNCQSPRHWQQPEIDFLTQVAVQVGVALERAKLLHEQTVVSEQQRMAKEKLQQRALKLLMAVEPISRGDLTIRAEVTEDEIGTIADSYNATVENLRSLVTQVTTVAQQFSETTNNNEHLIENLAEESLKQLEKITVAGDGLTAMSKSINFVTENAEQTLTAFQKASENVVAGEQAINQTMDGIISLQDTVTESTKKIQHLGESSQKISKVVNLISRFAAQTHLLALKASIEAARAGEQGRGFAVIADEVRGLATSSAEATAEIETLVNSIQSETKEVTQTMKTGTEQVLRGTELVEQTRNSLQQITVTSQQIDGLVTAIFEAAKDQSLTSKSMNEVMGDVSTIAENTSVSVLDLAKSFQDILLLAQQLQANVERFKVE
ncbi:methyl-accepting chemotaxis protein [Crocosphaera sp.]|uniref:methyl-accepting chemotaxis protein n=1 Tax=Crocosphaera sp. TaxID=2729996 RepID=UPI00262B37AF|nr:methyl-accepting chemotaxis protein [Crocosphaera sp.]MDJ0579566.1 methyl-accepting chemotaxis protein [Crocosphaera sp.]